MLINHGSKKVAVDCAWYACNDSNGGRVLLIKKQRSKARYCYRGAFCLNAFGIPFHRLLRLINDADVERQMGPFFFFLLSSFVSHHRQFGLVFLFFIVFYSFLMLQFFIFIILSFFNFSLNQLNRFWFQCSFIGFI